MKSIEHTEEVLKTLSAISKLIPLVKTTSQLKGLQEMVESLGKNNIEYSL